MMPTVCHRNGAFAEMKVRHRNGAFAKMKVRHRNGGGRASASRGEIEGRFPPEHRGRRVGIRALQRTA